MPEESHIYVVNEELFLKLMAENVARVPESLRVDPENRLAIRAVMFAWDGATERMLRLEAGDGTLRSQVVLWDYTGNVQIRAAGEPATGQAQTSLFGYDGAALRRLKTETTGELDTVLHGKDAGGNIDPLRTNANQQLQVEVVGIPTAPTKRVVPAVAIGAAVADVWVPGLAGTIYLDVEFEVVNVDGAVDVTVDLGIDYDNDAGAIERYFLRTMPIRAGEAGVRIGPYRISGDDAIMAGASAAGDAELHIYVVDEGTAS